MPYVGNKSTTFNTFSATDVSITDDLTVTDDASVGGDLTVTGDLVISAGGTLDVFNSGNASTTLTALLGADNGAGNGRTNSTTKVAIVGMPHYTNAEESVGLIVAGSLSGESFIEIGGGSSVVNAATSVHIRTASNTTSTGGTQRLTVNSSGDIDVETGDIFFSTSGQGIVLGATSNVGSSNTLNDYEEGLHTATLTMGSGTAALSSNRMGYIKVGHNVTVYGELVVGSISSPSGGTKLSLPFATAVATGGATGNREHFCGQAIVSYNTPFSANNAPVLVANGHNLATVQILYMSDDGGFNSYTPATGDTFYISFTYATSV